LEKARLKAELQTEGLRLPGPTNEAFQ